MENWIELLRNFWTLLQQGQLPEIGRWNYLLLAMLVAIEGPIITLLGAATASAGLMRPLGVFAAAAAGNLTADTLWYLLGYFGKFEVILRVGRLVKIKKEHLDRFTLAVQKHTLKILFISKLTAGFMIPALIATGLAHIPWKRWFPVLLLGEMIWTGMLVIIGYYTTETIKVVAGGVGLLGLIASILLIIILFWQGRRILLKTKEISEVIYGVEENSNKDVHPDR